MTRILILLLLGSFVLQAGELKLEKEASWIKATARATGHNFEAFPKNYLVEIGLDDSGKIATAVFSSKVADLTTEKAKRDKEMFHWLELESFPEFSFTMTRLEERGGKQIMIGDFNLHNKKVSIEIPVTQSEKAGKIEIDGTTTINTTDFDLPIIKKMGFLTVQPEVVVTFHLVGTR